MVVQARRSRCSSSAALPRGTPPALGITGLVREGNVRGWLHRRAGSSSAPPGGRRSIAYRISSVPWLQCLCSGQFKAGGSCLLLACLEKVFVSARVPPQQFMVGDAGKYPYAGWQYSPGGYTVFAVCKDSPHTRYLPFARMVLDAGVRVCGGWSLLGLTS